MIYIGIDPGAKGGYAYIMDGAVRARPWDSTVFVQDMYCLSNVHGHTLVACVERVGAMPGQGVKSMFNFGMAYGYIQGVLEALGIPYQTVPPATWKREYSLIGKDKRASIEACRRLFPDIDLRRSTRCRTDADGMAEALLMAEYARRHM